MPHFSKQKLDNNWKGFVEHRIKKIMEVNKVITNKNLVQKAQSKSHQILRDMASFNSIFANFFDKEFPPLWD